MTDPTTLLKSIDSAAKVANTPLFTTVIDKLLGYKLSTWAAEGEVRKKIILDEYENAKKSGIIGMQYIEYLRHNENLINTAIKSADYIDPSKPNEIKMDNDFFWNTIQYAKTISNAEIQELIAKIIAGEYNNPGSYSMSTLHCLKMLGKKELELFEILCSFIVNNDMIPHDLFSGSHSSVKIVNDVNFDFGDLQLLVSLGLLLPNPMARRIENENTIFTLNYFHQKINFEFVKSEKKPFNLPGFYCLSKTGLQLIKHINPIYNDDYYYYLKKNYKISNFKIIESEEK